MLRSKKETASLETLANELKALAARVEKIEEAPHVAAHLAKPESVGE